MRNRRADLAADVRLSLYRKYAEYLLRCIVFGMVIILFIPVCSWAHGLAGKRFFPTTFTVDDPFISDEFSVLLNHIKQSGGPSARSTEMSIDYSKRILPNFGLEFSETYQHVDFTGDGSANGWENVEAGAKWQFLTSEEHEMILSIGTALEIGGTGAREVSESFSTISPAFFFGKGMGDLPESAGFLRPFAVTGAIGPSFPTRSRNVFMNKDGSTETERNPTTLDWGFTLQYSLMYLQSFVKDIGLGVPFNRMIIVTEFPMQTNLSRDNKGKTTGTINPGLVWCGKSVELGIAAEIPINSHSGKSVGILGLVHLFIDDLFPKSLGRPIFP